MANHMIGSLLLSIILHPFSTPQYLKTTHIKNQMSSITVRVPIQRHWKKSPPNAHALSLIRQVRYNVEFDEDENDGMLDIFEVNVLKPIHEQRSHWRRFPASYLPFIKRIIYRTDLYIDSLDSIVDNRPKSSYSMEAVRKLKYYIQYTDNVIMQIWEDTRLAAMDNELGPDWRCPSLDQWLRIEFYVKRHDISDVETYMSESQDWLMSDPFELGKFIYICNKLSDTINTLEIGLNMRLPSLYGITVAPTIMTFRM